jgi:three-Cys-motif partner protein
MMVNAENGKLPEHYKGKEQSYIKHSLLKAYLERLFMIIGQHQKTICYVDCFAGPWQAKGENLEDTSIAISLEIIKKCREGLRALNQNVQFKALFIEEDPNAFSKLENFLATKKSEGISTKPLHGEFFALRQEILDWCGKDSFAFFFIDPTGWKEAVEPLTLKPLLQRPNSEFLINFMYDFLVRTHTQKPFEDDMIEVFGEAPVTEGMAPEEREQHLINLYKNHLKKTVSSIGSSPRTAYVKILKPIKDRTLYHLVYLTHHPLGIIKFMEASEKLDIVQKKVREAAKQEHRTEKSKQAELYASDEYVEEDRHIELSEVKNYWLAKLSSEPRYFGTEEFADMLEETGWFMGDFQKAFGELVKDGKAQNLDDQTSKRRSRFVHYETNSGHGERLAGTDK